MASSDHQLLSFKDDGRTPQVDVPSTVQPGKTPMINVFHARLEKPLIQTCAADLKWCIEDGPDMESDLIWLGAAIPNHYYTALTAERFRTPRPVVFNRFPRMQDLVRKRWLARILRSLGMLQPKLLNFFPETLFLPEDIETVRQRLRLSRSSLPMFSASSSNAKKSRRDRGSDTVYILKPNAGAQGIGLKLVNRIEDIPANILWGAHQYIIQKYISNPMRLMRKKFDIRVYALITKVCPELEAYIGCECLTRFCTEDYAPPDKSNLQNVFMHYTNFTINKENKRFVESSNIHSPFNSKRYFHDVLKDLYGKKYNPASIWSQIIVIVQETLIALQPLLQLSYKFTFKDWADVPHHHCFQILGFDILLDETGRAWLLEVNSNPSLRTSFQQSSRVSSASLDTPQHTKRSDTATLEAASTVSESPIDHYIKYPLVKEALKIVEHRLLLTDKRQRTVFSPRGASMPGSTNAHSRPLASYELNERRRESNSNQGSMRPSYFPFFNQHRSEAAGGPVSPSRWYVAPSLHRVLLNDVQRGDGRNRIRNYDIVANALEKGPTTGTPGILAPSKTSQEDRRPNGCEHETAYNTTFSDSSTVKLFASLQHWMPIALPNENRELIELGLKKNRIARHGREVLQRFSFVSASCEKTGVAEDAAQHPNCSAQRAKTTEDMELPSCWGFLQQTLERHWLALSHQRRLMSCCRELFEQATHFPRSPLLKFSHWEAFTLNSRLREIVSTITVPCVVTLDSHTSPWTSGNGGGGFGFCTGPHGLSSLASTVTRGRRRSARPAHRSGAQHSGTTSEDAIAARMSSSRPLPRSRRLAHSFLSDVPSRSTSTRLLSWADLKWMYYRPLCSTTHRQHHIPSCSETSEGDDRSSSLVSANRDPNRRGLGFWSFWELLIQLAALLHTASAVERRDALFGFAIPAKTIAAFSAEATPVSHFSSLQRKNTLQRGHSEGKPSAVLWGERQSTRRFAGSAAHILDWWPDTGKIAKKVLELDAEGLGQTVDQLFQTLLYNLHHRQLSTSLKDPAKEVSALSRPPVIDTTDAVTFSSIASAPTAYRTLAPTLPAVAYALPRNKGDVCSSDERFSSVSTRPGDE